MSAHEQLAAHGDGGMARRIVAARRDVLIVVGVALGLRLLFLALTANTYDYDEFVLLTLARDWAHGAMPYRDFMFFHPPGALMLLSDIESLTSAWWPAARLLSTAADVATAGMVWKIGTLLWGRRAGLAAGLLYAASPLALISAVRVGQDPLITAAGVAGLLALLGGNSRRRAVIAGVAIGLGIWIKYPAVYFLPIYLLAAPRRMPLVLGAAAASLALLFAPFRDLGQPLYDQTILFQSTRYLMDGSTRLGTGLVWWLGANVLAILGLAIAFRRQPRPPPWVIAGFVLGGVFLLASQVYYHYFVPAVPFACILAAPLVAGAALRARGLLVRAPGHRRTDRSAPLPSSGTAEIASLTALGVGVTLLWAAVLNSGGSSPLYVTAAKLSDIAPAISLIERDTPPGSTILGDRFEYAYLSNRRALAHYFWDEGPLLDPHFLERRLAAASAAVLSTGASSGFQSGVVQYLDRTMQRHEAGPVTVWVRR